MPEARYLTPRKEAFAKGYGRDLLNQVDAARLAGYSQPRTEITRLMEDPKVVNRIIEYLRTSAMKWKSLSAKAKGVLWEGMDAEKTAKDGSRVADMGTRLEAARIVLLTLKKNGKLLEDAADDEDAAGMTTIELARSIVGPVAVRDIGAGDGDDEPALLESVVETG